MNEADIQAYLEHHGVKGMKWGHHTAQSGPSATEIHVARGRQQQRKQAYRTSVKTGDTAGANRAAKEFNTSKDRITAAHLTKGEKVATALLGGGFAAHKATSASNLSKGKVAANYVLNSYAGVLTVPIQKHRIKNLQIQRG